MFAASVLLSMVSTMGDPPTDVSASASEPLGLEITWDAPRECPDQAALVDDLEHLTARPIASSSHPRVIAHIQRGDGDFELVLDLELPPTAGTFERRKLESEDCGTLARAAALMVALAIAPVETAEQVVLWVDNSNLPLTASSVPIVPTPQPPPPPEFAAQPSTEAASDSSPPTQPVQHRFVGHRFEGFVGGGAVYGLVPRTTGIVTAELAWRYRALRLGLTVMHAFAQERFVEREIGIRGELTGGGLSASWLPPNIPVVSLELGGSVELGQWRGEGIGDRVNPRTARSFWAAIAVRAGIAWPPTGRLAASLRAEAVVPIARPRIALTDGNETQTVYHQMPVSARISAGFILRLP